MDERASDLWSLGSLAAVISNLEHLNLPGLIPSRDASLGFDASYCKIT